MMRSYLPPEIKRAVRKRDQNRCTICGAGKPLAVHHILPVSEGGTDEPENLTLLCWPCHKVVHQERGDDYAEGMAEDPALTGETGTNRLVMWQAATEWMARQKMPGRTMQVYLTMLGAVIYGNWIRKSQTTIATELGLAKAEVSRAIKRLNKAGIVIIYDYGEGSMYRLSPHVGWKGAWSEYWTLVGNQEHRGMLAEAQERGLKVLMGGRNK